MVALVDAHQTPATIDSAGTADACPGRCSSPGDRLTIGTAGTGTAAGWLPRSMLVSSPATIDSAGDGRGMVAPVDAHQAPATIDTTGTTGTADGCPGR